MKNTIIGLILSITLVISGLSVVSLAFAQNNTYNTAPANGGNTTDQTSGATSTNNGFDWRWLLPLLAIPILFLFLGDRKEGDDTRYYDQGIRGAKGGKTSREKDDEETVVVE